MCCRQFKIYKTMHFAAMTARTSACDGNHISKHSKAASLRAKGKGHGKKTDCVTQGARAQHHLRGPARDTVSPCEASWRCKSEYRGDELHDVGRTGSCANRRGRFHAGKKSPRPRAYFLHRARRALRGIAEFARSLANFTGKLAAQNINVTNAYGTAPKGSKKAILIFRVSDLDKAALIQ